MPPMGAQPTRPILSSSLHASAHVHDQEMKDAPPGDGRDAASDSSHAHHLVTSTRTARFGAALQARVAAAKVGSKHASAAPLSPPAPSPDHQQGAAQSAIVIDATCHCLILDQSTLSRDANDDQQQLALALSLLHDHDALLAHMITWMPSLSKATVAATLVETKHKRVHIHFASHAALAAALRTNKRLVRCQSIDTP